MTLREPLADGHSPLHQLDPRVKLAVAAAYSIVLAAAARPGVLVGGVVASAAMLVCARLPWRIVARRLLVANSFVGLLWLVLPWSITGEPLGKWGPVVLSVPGVTHAAVITLKCNAIVMAMMALLSTSTMAELAHGLAAYRLPSTLVGIIVLGSRYVGAILDEHERLTDAMKVRGFRAATTFHTYRTYARLMGTLLVRTYDRAVRIHEAMLCRGFRGEYPLLRRLKLCRRDWLAGGVVLAATALLAFMQWGIGKP